MEKKFIAGGAITGLVLAAGLVGAVSAQTAAEATALTEEQAAEIALMEIAGEVQEIEVETEDGTTVFEVEILDADGVEFEIVLAADTGEVLEVENESDDKDCDRDHDDDDDDEGDDDEDDGEDA